jgi:hypothetical protein
MGFVIRSFQVITLLLAAACGRSPSRSEPSPNTPAVLRVENQHFTDMVIYAVSGGSRVRLGIATGNSTKSFTIPNYLIRGARQLQFVADPIGGNRTPVSQEMTVRPGDIISLTIPP